MGCFYLLSIIFLNFIYTFAMGFNFCCAMIVIIEVISLKDKILKVILAMTFLTMIFSFCSIPSIVKADIGFDGDYDGGYDSGWDSDYDSGYDSWDDDDDDYYYYGSSSGDGYSGGADAWVVFLALLICVVPIVVVLLIVHLSDRKPRRKEYPINTFGMPVDDDLNMQVYLMYKELNDAWMKKNLEPVRHLLTDEMYNMYLMQLDELIDNGLTNVMTDYLFVSGHISSRRKYRGKETIVMIFRIKFKDYIVNENGYVVRGKARDVLDYTYELKLVRDVSDNKLVCPSCGYNVKSKEGVVCPHCGSVIHANTSELRLADKKIIYQIRSKR